MKKLVLFTSLYLVFYLVLIIILLLTSVLTSVLASATTIKLDLDKERVQLGETIKFHLIIQPSKPVGGTFSVNKLVSEKRVKLVRILYSKPSPGSCYTCVGGYPLSENLDRNFYFKAREEGNYYAEANFGDAKERVNFTVFSPTTSTTTITASPLPTTSTFTTTSSSTTTSTTTTITTITSEKSSTSSTAAEEESGGGGISLAILLIFLGVILIFIFIFIAIIANR
jgi:hypothetical protein